MKRRTLICALIAVVGAALATTGLAGMAWISQASVNDDPIFGFIVLVLWAVFATAAVLGAITLIFGVAPRKIKRKVAETLIGAFG